MKTKLYPLLLAVALLLGIPAFADDAFNRLPYTQIEKVLVVNLDRLAPTDKIVIGTNTITRAELEKLVAEKSKPSMTQADREKLLDEVDYQFKPLAGDDRSRRLVYEEFKFWRQLHYPKN